jgi:hypothetical protein
MVRALACLSAMLLGAHAQAWGQQPAVAREQEEIGPHCLCWEAEPAMEYGGRTVAAIQGVSSGLLNRLPSARREPAIVTAWEFPIALGLLLLQHEVMGHGSRAREFDLDPSYGVGIEFSAYTEIHRNPSSNEQNVLLAAGGTEATGVLARRLTVDLHQPGGAEGSSVPLLLFSKMDLTLYALATQSPKRDSSDEFEDQYDDGNDIAVYLVSRQGLRAGASPDAVWDRSYAVDFGDRLLRETWNDVRLTALWNLFDPAMILSTIGYFKKHVFKGNRLVTPTTWKVSRTLGLTAGTRGALGVGEVTRFFDVYLTTKRGVGSLYVRDLNSSTDRTHGYGVGFHRLRIGSHVKLSAQGDWWDEPRAAERVRTHSGWNGALELDWVIRGGWGVTAKTGKKSEGFLPGLPLADGWYTGFGILGNF